ncbi:nuclear transport factor 2 family protein [Hyphococcus luteus]|uniref:SnoaL-like domain-containing protein n=1 Tax=Hyphococcus luteus TaxID=2058213 RepID=A0A2S7K531_9PROT|nr:nuclear transport factor 2 family protein [Marinicaulis flavus]PQA87602.1 hypothetical protein CW354_11010 [Marinicaulis flavus]
MRREDFEDYIKAFNNADFEGFAKYYADNVEFVLGGRMRLSGRQAVVDFYREVKAHIDEHLEIIDLLVAPDGFAMHSRTTFKTVKDWPGFELWSTKAGDVRKIESIILYRLEDGFFKSIKSARFAQLS